MDKQFKVGIIGSTGRGDYGHAVDVAFTKLNEVEIVAVADDDPTGLAAAQSRTGAARAYATYREMLAREQLDVVAICPRWIDQHHAMLLAAAEAGCHVYMEKPFCRTLAECDEVITQLEMRHLRLGIAHHSVYSPVLTRVLELIAAGEIGEVLELRGRGKEDRRGGGEDLWVLGSHVFALMRLIAGAQPQSCAAVVYQDGRPLERRHASEGAEGIGLLAGDHLQATFQFPRGITGYFASRRNQGGSPSHFGLQVLGSKGIIELTTNYLDPASLLRDPAWSPRRSGKSWETITSAGIGQPEPRSDGTYEGGHIAAIRDLLAAIGEQRPTRCTAEDCRGIVEMTAAIFAAALEQRTVSLPLTDRTNPLAND